MARRIVPALHVYLLAAALLIATCAIGLGLAAGQGPAIPVASGADQTGWASTADLINLGVPLSGDRRTMPLRLEQITFEGRSPHVHLLGVIAFRPDRFGYHSLMLGNLLQHCRAAYQPVPLTDIVIPPHTDPDWDVMAVFRIDRPGRYVVGPVRISYTEAGHLGWQDQNLGTTIVVSAARPGQKPVFDSC
jgi:hypothetical protein